jgi:hypothetical protein
MLRALRLPVTPTSVAAAKLALESPERLPNALATLERALPASDDPRVTTLRTVAAFVGRIEPASPVLAAQIAAFVDHAVEGAEPKIAQLLYAQSTANDDAPLDAATSAQRATALQFDLKSQLLSLANDPPAGGGAALADAVSGALTALTALQLSAATTLAALPGGIAFALPVTLPGGVAQAQVRIDRDAPEGSAAPLDGDNFHIAFMLETQHVGSVAIDLVTVGRSVTIGVKTEAVRAARAFSDALGGLTARLEQLRYRVVRADSSVVSAGMTKLIETGGLDHSV